MKVTVCPNTELPGEWAPIDTDDGPSGRMGNRRSIREALSLEAVCGAAATGLARVVRARPRAISIQPLVRR